MPVLIHCPSCQRQLRLPEELSGRLVQCPTCSHTFQAQTVQASGSDPPPEGLEEKPPVSSSSPDTAAGELQLNLSLDDDTAPRGLKQIPPPPPPMRLVPLGPESGESAAKRPERLVPCPYCGEDIQASADRCRFCGERVDDEDDDASWDRSAPFPMRLDLEPHRGTLILTLGIISVAAIGICAPLGLPFAIAAWAMGTNDIRKMDANVMDPRGRSNTNAGRICGIIGTILDVLCGFFYGLMFMQG